MALPIIAMREMRATLYGLEIRVCKYADPQTGRWTEFVQVRRRGQSWGEAAPLENVA